MRKCQQFWKFLQFTLNYKSDQIINHFVNQKKMNSQIDDRVDHLRSNSQQKAQIKQSFSNRLKFIKETFKKQLTLPCSAQIRKHQLDDEFQKQINNQTQKIDNLLEKIDLQQEKVKQLHFFTPKQSKPNQRKSQREKSEIEEQYEFYREYYEIELDNCSYEEQLIRSQTVEQFNNENYDFIDPNLDQLVQFSKDLIKEDFTFLKKHERFLCLTLQQLITYWQFHRLNFQEIMVLLVDLLKQIYGEFRISHQDKFQNVYEMPYSSIIYHKLLILFDTFQKKNLNPNRQIQYFTVQHLETNNYFIHFVNELKTQTTRKGPYSIDSQINNGERRSLMQIVNNLNSSYLKQPFWPGFFSKAKALYLKQSFSLNTPLSEANLKKQSDSKLYKRAPAPCNNLDNQAFFYSGVNIYDLQINNCMISLFGNIKDQLKSESYQQFYQEVTALLNSEGGVVLWDCQLKYMKLLPIGDILTEKQKNNISKKLKKLLQNIEPEVKLGVDCHLQFIPVAENPLFTPNQVSPIFKEGCYLTVLRVLKRKMETEAYYYPQQKKIFFKAFSLSQPVVIQEEKWKKIKKMAFNKKIFIEKQKKDRQLILLEYLKQFEQLEKIKPSISSLSIEKEESECFDLKKSNSLVRSKKEYQSLVCSIETDIISLSENILDQEQQINQYIRFEVDLLEKIVISIQELEQLDEIYSQDSKASSRSEKIENYDDTIIEYYDQVISLLSECREKVVERYEFLASRSQKKEEIALGKPLTQKKVWNCDLEGDPEKLFQFASLLISDRSSLEVIQKRLLLNNFQCRIVPLTSTQSLKGISTFAILYHNTQYSEISSFIYRNPYFKFNNKFLTMGPVTDYLFLASRNKNNFFQAKDFKNLQEKFKLDFPMQKLQLWKLKTPENQIQFYLSAETWISTSFLYLLLKNLGEKVLLKTPVIQQTIGPGIWEQVLIS